MKKAFILEADFPSMEAAQEGLDRMMRWGVTNYGEHPEIYSYGSLDYRLYAIRCFV